MGNTWKYYEIALRNCIYNLQNLDMNKHIFFVIVEVLQKIIESSE